MTLDMATYSSLLQAAKAEHDLGDLKAAFASYLKAHTVIIRILQEQVVFRNQDSIESAPDNYLQLIAHGQEILRRIKDIMTQSSASSSSTPSRQSKTTPSLSPSPSTRPGLTSQTSQRSITTTSQINKRTKKNVPLIPISPLTRQMLVYSHTLSQVTQRFEQAKQGSGTQDNSVQSGTRDLAQLRRLTEDVRIQKARLDAVNTQIQSVVSSTITSWDPDTIARQLTIIDLQLFKDIAIPKDLVRADRKATCVQHCIDFETFVAHSVAHVLLIDWDTQRQLTPASSSTNVKGHTQIPVNAVAHMIRVAYILLNVYRNMNSFMAIMRALTSPEITRMHKSWSGVNSKAKELYRRMAAVYRAQDNGRSYKDTLLQKLDAFQDVGKDAVVAIPWMRYHLDEVRSIVNSYLTGQSSADGSGDVVLSAPGARKLSAVSAVLTQCRTNETSGFDRQDMDDNPTQSKAHTKQHREPVLVDGLKLPLTPILDLMSLGSGDLALHHWLLSRPFLNKQQLIDESLEIEPLSSGEELACYDMPFDNSNSDDIGSADEDPTGDDSFVRVIAPEHDLEPLPRPQVSRLTVRPSLARDRVSESDVNSILSELLKDDASDNKGLFDDVDDEEAGENAGESSQLKDTPEHSRDVLQFLGVNPDEHSDSDDDDDLGGGLTHEFSASTKDKGKASKTDDSDEINDLLARVKGLVQESRKHMSDMEFNELDMDIKQVTDLQDSQDDQPDRSADHQPSDPPSRTEASSVLSLEDLRRQLESLDREASTTGDSKTHNLIIVDTTVGSKSELEKSKDDVPSEGNENASDKNGDSIPTISIAELDKIPSDSSQLSLNISTSTLPSESLMTATTTATTTTITTTTTTTSSRATVLDSEDHPFKLEASPLEGVVEPGNPGFKAASGPSEPSETDGLLQPRGIVKEDISKNETSESHRAEGGASGSAGTPVVRQRRRIAGGVISSKTLLSKASTSSLYSSFNHDPNSLSGDEGARGHEPSQDKALEGEQERDVQSTSAESWSHSGNTAIKEERRGMVKVNLTEAVDVTASETGSLPTQLADTLEGVQTADSRDQE